ncbi:MBL fold metallo-hydrolase [Vibrio parahaemolyticus]|uniref:MBL fold metallo-hydrolase n=1 Tax=Vibrio parahaemolyticus TaxID=670 RepID=UPI003B530480
METATWQHLIDCGLFQGKGIHFCNRKTSLDIEFPVKHIKALVLTHAHIDHTGRLPWLLADGFKGPSNCTKATAELVPLILEDGLKPQLGLNYHQRHKSSTSLKNS